MDGRMSEQPAQYSRTFVCRICGKSFEPPADEAEALAELERAFGMKAENASSVCEECAGRSVQ
jgi:Fe2+ or Zn2+ uptake regulation protein